MTSKVSGKTRLGAVCCVLLIAIALFAGCKQETPESYAPPGYGVSVGPLTDTEWKDDGKSFKFEANGKVSVPDSMKTYELYGKKIELGDFTYTISESKVTINGIVKKLPNGENTETFYVSGYDYITVSVGDTSVIGTLTINGSKAADSNVKIGPYKMIDSKYEVTYSTTVPTRENYVGDYYDENGRKKLQIKDDGTAISYSNGTQSVSYWKYHNENDSDKGIEKGTIWIAADEDLLTDEGSHKTYTLYPHALISGSYVYWK